MTTIEILKRLVKENKLSLDDYTELIMSLSESKEREIYINVPYIYTPPFHKYYPYDVVYCTSNVTGCAKGVTSTNSSIPESKL